MQEIVFAFGTDKGKKTILNILPLVMFPEELSFIVPFCQALVAAHRENTLIHSFV